MRAFRLSAAETLLSSPSQPLPCRPSPSLPIFFITFLISYPPASVTVIQIPIVIYVDINGNPRGCPARRALAPLPPSRRPKDAATFHPSRPRVQILCFIESELSLLLLASRRLPFRVHPPPPPPPGSLRPSLARFTVADNRRGRVETEHPARVMGPL